MRERADAAGRLIAWIIFLITSLAVLHEMGDGALAAPPASDLAGWLEARGAATAVFALLRLAAIAVGWYLLSATVAAIALRVARADLAARLAETCAPPPIRRLIRTAAGLTLAASAVAVSGAAAREAPGPVVMRRLPDDGAVTMSRIEPAPVRPAVAERTTPESPASPPTSPTWTVKAGDHFWSIAEGTLAEAWRRPPTDAEIDPYWRQLVEVNRKFLTDPANADLLLPGQTVEVPPTPPVPG